MIKLVLFASGSGSNVENIINYFKNSDKIIITKVFCNKKEAGVFERCKRLQVPCGWFSKTDFLDETKLLHQLKKDADYLILAGFLMKIPSSFVAAFPNKIINIHPALLPKYGGKGMYGMHVHNAVKENNEQETGITIHFVNEDYDEGAIIFQAKTNIDDTDTPENIAQKVHILEYEHFPKVVEDVVLKSSIK